MGDGKIMGAIGNMAQNFANNVSDTTGDLANRMLTGAGIKDKPETAIQRNPDGNAVAVLDLSDVPPSQRDSIQAQADAAATHIYQLKDQLAEATKSGDTAKMLELAKDIGQAQEALDNFKFEVENGKLGLINIAAAALVGPAGLIAIDTKADMGRVDGAGAQLLVGEANVALEGHVDIDAPPKPEVKAEVDPTQQRDLSGVESPKTSLDKMKEAGAKALEEQKASGAGESGETGEAGKADFSAEELLHLMETDFDAALEKFDGLDSEQRQMYMMQMQRELQQMNQMFSMVSNFLKVQHDTAKAAINNMRV